ncbi:hypothetical protein [Streptomyces sp. AD55]|uniref:hypothetical protein n=1 Tax=Streptomyces sp. AD55 TaxID=3242895 RepID=UPI00352934D1
MTVDSSPPRPDAHSDATRLLCAGTYLDPVYRKAVIRELLGERYRVVAPSYGYDAVPVLAHALAALNLRRAQVAVLLAGAAVLTLLLAADVLDGPPAVLLFAWLTWATLFVRRVAILQTLITRLRPRGDDGGGFDGRYPATRHLTPELTGKIAREQADGTVFYGGYKPFVGSGVLVRRWSNAELLIGTPVDPPGLAERLLRDGQVPAPGTGPDTPPPGTPVRRRPIVPFTPDEITSRVAERMLAELRGTPRPADRVRALSVGRRRFTTAVETVDGLPPTAPPRPRAEDEHWREGYDADREYLCVRIGSWEQELVVTVFVGFDIKGNTLHTEFYTYVLAPVVESFRLVDRLPARIDTRMMWRIAWDVTRNGPGEFLRLITNPLRERLPRRLRRDTVRARIPQPDDHSEFRLGRYALTVVNRGARTSVREMATNDRFHHFFQETDAGKYTQIVERHLLQIVGDFLRDHDVDTRDHEAHQTHILQQNFGADSTNNFGGNQSVNNRGHQTFDAPPGTREARPA